MGYLSNYIENYRKANKPSFQLFNWTKFPRETFDLTNVSERLIMTGRLFRGITFATTDMKSVVNQQQQVRDLVLSITKTGV